MWLEDAERRKQGGGRKRKPLCNPVSRLECANGQLPPPPNPCLHVSWPKALLSEAVKARACDLPGHSFYLLSIPVSFIFPVPQISLCLCVHVTLGHLPRSVFRGWAEPTLQMEWPGWCPRQCAVVAHVTGACGDGDTASNLTVETAYRFIESLEVTQPWHWPGA